MRRLMTLLAISKALDAESALVVMTRETTLRSLRRMMHQGLRRCDLMRLWHPGSRVVAISTTQSLPRTMFRMTKTHSVSAGLRGSPHVTARRVARRAGRDVAPRSTLRALSVTLEAGRMSIESGWN